MVIVDKLAGRMIMCKQGLIGIGDTDQLIKLKKVKAKLKE